MTDTDCPPAPPAPCRASDDPCTFAWATCLLPAPSSQCVPQEATASTGGCSGGSLGYSFLVLGSRDRVFAIPEMLLVG